MQPRWHGKLKILEELFTQVKTLRPADAPTIKGKTFVILRKCWFNSYISTYQHIYYSMKCTVNYVSDILK